MRSFLLVVIGAIIGAVATFFLASGVLTGIGAGVGIVTGIKSGVCLAAEAAKSKGYITAEQVDELIAAAAQQIAGEKLASETALTGSDAECQKVIAEMKKAAATAK